MDKEANDLSLPSYVSPSGHTFFFGPVNKGQYAREHQGQLYWNPFFEIFLYLHDENGNQTDRLVKVRFILQSSVADPYSVDATDFVAFDPREHFLLRDIWCSTNEPEINEVEKRVIFCFHEDQYQNLLAAGYPLHQIIGFEEHFGEIIEDGPVKEMLRQEFSFFKELVHTVSTRRKAWKLFDPLCEIDDSYAHLKYQFQRRTTHKADRKFKKILNGIIDKHFTNDFLSLKPIFAPAVENST
ncbi:Oidioi.mRNA.OKI2018_I69.PAR.g12476.t1.cds [Oikopleura dioica]|uniref:Oidioi.mRNA.OKI2018_I69.PAR.g12476.t1.cds n=1 Tax=Oikopleura dioica TaxID=34765 RepID=A0ABN7S083_OIKDI|nr:Oidioi.mRNA.OKI2018_I69.PAR.g12476.t1.cds [Oikopleura dioica]